MKNTFYFIFLALTTTIFALSEPIPVDNSDINIQIVDKGIFSSEELAGFLSVNNSEISFDYAKELAEIYIEEAGIEDINSDLAFIQMCLETGFLSFTGVVKAEQNNFCGLGAINRNQEGAYFDSIKMGIRAHIQHLKAYATKTEPVHKIIDPRFHLVSRGSASCVTDLTGKWAGDPLYGNKLIHLYSRLSSFNFFEYNFIAN